MSLFCPWAKGSPHSLSQLSLLRLWWVPAWGEVSVLEALSSRVLVPAFHRKEP